MFRCSWRNVIHFLHISENVNIVIFKNTLFPKTFNLSEFEKEFDLRLFEKCPLFIINFNNFDSVNRRTVMACSL